MPSRRKTLKILGGGTIVAATAASVGFFSSRTPHKALAPWSQAGTYDEPRRHALSYAILAPNPHNLQPWLVEFEGEDGVTLYRDPERTLPHTDPYGRQLTIGLGCFLELFTIAAANIGYRVNMQLFPDGKAGPVARARFVSGQERDPLFDYVLQRRSCKEPFEDRPIPSAAIEKIQALAQVITEESHVAQLRDLIWAAWKTEIATPRTYRESVDLMRFGKQEINASPDGIDLGGGFLETLMLVGMMSREKQLDRQSRTFQEGVRIYRDMFAATPAFCVMTSEDNNRETQIDIGRRWLRLNLLTTSLGLSLHPVSQALQEYREMAPHYARAHAMLAEDGQTVQLLGRLGFGPQVPPSPRWPLESKIARG